MDVAPPQVDDPPPPPPPTHGVDDDAGAASQESHVTSPVVVVPLSQDLIAADLTVERLQTFRRVDDVVGVQLQPVPAPPPNPPQLLIHHFLTE